jgi:hypothetical protein
MASEIRILDRGCGGPGRQRIQGDLEIRNPLGCGPPANQQEMMIETLLRNQTLLKQELDSLQLEKPH